MFVRNQDGWRFRPSDDDQELALLGNLIPEDVTQPVFLGRPGRTIVITQDQSNQAITTAVGSGLDPSQSAMLNSVYEAHFNRRKHDKGLDTITIYAADKTTPLYVFDADDALTDISPQ